MSEMSEQLRQEVRNKVEVAQDVDKGAKLRAMPLDPRPPPHPRPSDLPPFLHHPSRRARRCQARHRREHREAAAALRAQTAELDGLDDAIGAANALLNRHPGWPVAWDLQTAPLREDLDAVAELRDALADAADAVEQALADVEVPHP